MDSDWLWGEATDEDFEEAMAALPVTWGQGDAFRYIAPSIGDVAW